MEGRGKKCVKENPLAAYSLVIIDKLGFLQCVPLF